MNKLLRISSLFLLLGASALATDWESMSRRPAQITVPNMKSTPLVGGKGKTWAWVPEVLWKHRAIVYWPEAKHQGVVDIRVTGDGYLLLACNFDYQGTKGPWLDERWREKDFVANGWTAIPKTELDGALIQGDNRVQALFWKQVRRGETYRLRCNKYDPPYPILLGRR